MEAGISQNKSENIQGLNEDVFVVLDINLWDVILTKVAEMLII